jgi:hypothetical protein
MGARSGTPRATMDSNQGGTAQDVFSAWQAHNRDQAAKNATPAAVSQIFAQSFSAADGRSFEACQGVADTVVCRRMRV